MMSYNTINHFDDQRHEALMGVWWSGVILKKQSRNFFARFNSSEAQFNVMIVLKYAETPLTQQALSERLLVDKSNMTGLLDRMERAGLLARNPVPQDRRRYHLALTPQGLALLEQMEVPYRLEIQSIMTIFSETELHQLTDMMARLQNRLLADGIQGGKNRD